MLLACSPAVDVDRCFIHVDRTIAVAVFDSLLLLSISSYHPNKILCNQGGVLKPVLLPFFFPNHQHTQNNKPTVQPLTGLPGFAVHAGDDAFECNGIWRSQIFQGLTRQAAWRWSPKCFSWHPCVAMAKKKKSLHIDYHVHDMVWLQETNIPTYDFALQYHQLDLFSGTITSA